MAMTEQEAKECLEAKLECMYRELAVSFEEGCDKNCDECDLLYAQGTIGEIKETFKLGIKELEEVEKLRKENRALKNRCRVITQGTMCFFCPMECSNRKEKYRGSKDECR